MAYWRIGRVVLIFLLIGLGAYYFTYSKPLTTSALFRTSFESGEFTPGMINASRPSSYSFTDSKIVPPGWVINFNTSGVFEWTESPARSGSKSIKMSNPEATVVATYKINLRGVETKNFTLSVWVKSNALEKSFAFVDVTYVDSNKIVVLERSKKVIGSNDWQEINLLFNVPEGVGNLFINLKLLNKNRFPLLYDTLSILANTAEINKKATSETVWFDDVELSLRSV